MVLFEDTTFLMGVTQPSRPWHEDAHSIEIPAYCMDVYEYPNKKGTKPTSNVSWKKSLSMCTDIGKTLCTSAQWERACQGTNKRMYSYGEQHNRNTCNTPIIGGGPGKNPVPLKGSGAFPDCHTPEGVFDLNGNVSEWVLDAWDGAPEPFNKRARVSEETWRILRGGTMWSNTFYGQDCTSRHGHEKNHWKNIDDGFRCCSAPISTSN
jgi:formylglycine-generating enzyme required for sulfatase activity